MNGHDEYWDCAWWVRCELALGQLACEVYDAQLRTAVPVETDQLLDRNGEH